MSDKIEELKRDLKSLVAAKDYEGDGHYYAALVAEEALAYIQHLEGGRRHPDGQDLLLRVEIEGQTGIASCDMLMSPALLAVSPVGPQVALGWGVEKLREVVVAKFIEMTEAKA